MVRFGELKEDLLRALTSELTGLGFLARRGPGRFERKGSDGVSHGFHLLINESAPYARLDVHLSVRIEVVEAIFHRTSGYEKKHQSGTPTMGGALDAITGDPHFKLLLESGPGPMRACQLLFAPPMRAFYADWFDRFSRLDGIDRELNDDPHRETPNRPLPWLRCSTGAIVSRLLERPTYPAVAAAYSQIMQAVSNGFYWPRFEALLKDLERRAGNA